MDRPFPLTQSPMRRALALVVLSSSLAGTGHAAVAAGAPAAATACATTPIAVSDPALAPAPVFAVPPGGSCRVVGPGTGTALELVYPDGRIWARRVYAPVPQETTFHLADGTQLRVIPETRPASAPRAVLTRPGGRRTLIPEASGSSRPCLSLRFRTSGLPRMSLDLHGFGPGRVWLQAGRGGDWRRVRSDSRVRWQVSPRIAGGTARVYTVRLRAAGRTRLFPVCLLGPIRSAGQAR